MSSMSTSVSHPHAPPPETPLLPALVMTARETGHVRTNSEVTEFSLPVLIFRPPSRRGVLMKISLKSAKSGLNGTVSPPKEALSFLF